MNMFDTKKLSKSPKDKWEAMDLLVKSQQNLIRALHIMESIIANNDDDSKEFHEVQMKQFMAKFE